MVAFTLFATIIILPQSVYFRRHALCCAPSVQQLLLGKVDNFEMRKGSNKSLVSSRSIALHLE